MTNTGLSRQTCACHSTQVCRSKTSLLLQQKYACCGKTFSSSWQKYFCCNKHVFVLLQQAYFYRNKRCVCFLQQMRVRHDKRSLLWQNVCHDNIMFVVTNICCDKTFVTIKICLLWLANFCHDKTFVMTRIILVAAPANDSFLAVTAKTLTAIQVLSSDHWLRD